MAERPEELDVGGFGQHVAEVGDARAHEVPSGRVYVRVDRPGETLRGHGHDRTLIDRAADPVEMHFRDVPETGPGKDDSAMVLHKRFRAGGGEPRIEPEQGSARVERPVHGGRAMVRSPWRPHPVDRARIDVSKRS
ncbi:MAG: hypothetical protein LVQ64_06600, partial [Thermoplasmatales archaeon]|nr:hypothetical protein [Thermoplasmatales archaeon]